MWKVIAALSGDERLEEHAFEVGTHIIQGYMAGRYIKSGKGCAGISILLCSIAYQYAGYLRHKDTIRRDIRDYVAGLYIGLLVTKDK